MTKQRSLGVVFLLVVLAVSGLLLTWFWSSSGASTPGQGASEARSGGGKPKYPDPTPELIRTVRRIDLQRVSEAQAAELNAEIDAQMADWNSAKFLPATSPISALVSAWRPSVRDFENVLTPAQREALLRKLAEYARVRAQETPDAYIALAERETNLEWHDPEAPYRRGSDKPFRERLTWLFENYGDGKPDPDADTPDLLRDLWGPMMGKHGQRIAEVGVGERGAAIIIMRSRVPLQATNGGFAEPYASQHGLDIDRWDSYSTGLARPFQVPQRTSDDVLEERGIVTLAGAHVLVRLAISDEHLFKWGVYFFLDPETGEWRAEAMEKSGARNWQAIF